MLYMYRMQVTDNTFTIFSNLEIFFFGQIDFIECFKNGKF